MYIINFRQLKKALNDKRKVESKLINFQQIKKEQYKLINWLVSIDNNLCVVNNSPIDELNGELKNALYERIKQEGLFIKNLFAHITYSR